MNTAKPHFGTRLQTNSNAILNGFAIDLGLRQGPDFEPVQTGDLILLLVQHPDGELTPPSGFVHEETKNLWSLFWRFAGPNEHPCYTVYSHGAQGLMGGIMHLRGDYDTPPVQFTPEGLRALPEMPIEIIPTPHSPPTPS